MHISIYFITLELLNYAYVNMKMVRTYIPLKYKTGTIFKSLIYSSSVFLLALVLFRWKRENYFLIKN